MRPLDQKITLFRTDSHDHGFGYTLHAETYYNSSSVITSGQKIGKINDKGNLEIHLLITSNTKTLDLEYKTQVTHAFEIKPLPAQFLKGKIELITYVDRKYSFSQIISTDDALEDRR